MEKYLEIQAKILKPSAEAYTAEDIEKNKKVFFYVKAIKAQGKLDALPAGASLPSAKSTSTKLNELDFVKKLTGFGTEVSRNNKTNSNTSTASTLARKVLGNKVNANTQAFAAIQYLSATTNVPEAKAALKHEAFKAIPIEAFIAASAEVIDIMQETNLSDSEVKQFVSILLAKLKH